MIIVLLLGDIDVIPCHWPLGLLLSEGGHEILNVRNNLSASCDVETRHALMSLCISIHVDTEELKNGPSPCRVQDTNVGRWM